MFKVTSFWNSHANTGAVLIIEETCYTQQRAEQFLQESLNADADSVTVERV